MGSNKLVDKSLLKNRTASKYWKSLKKERNGFRLSSLSELLQFLNKIRDGGKKMGCHSKITLKVPKSVVSIVSKPLNELITYKIVGRTGVRSIASSLHSSLFESGEKGEDGDREREREKRMDLLSLVSRLVVVYQMTLLIYTNVMGNCTADYCPTMVSLSLLSLAFSLLLFVSLIVSLSLSINKFLHSLSSL